MLRLLPTYHKIPHWPELALRLSGMPVRDDSLCVRG